MEGLRARSKPPKTFTRRGIIPPTSAFLPYLVGAAEKVCEILFSACVPAWASLIPYLFTCFSPVLSGL
jgi:hypothetical protein